MSSEFNVAANDRRGWRKVCFIVASIVEGKQIHRCYNVWIASGFASLTCCVAVTVLVHRRLIRWANCLSDRKPEQFESSPEMTEYLHEILDTSEKFGLPWRGCYVSWYFLIHRFSSAWEETGLQERNRISRERERDISWLYHFFFFFFICPSNDGTLLTESTWLLARYYWYRILCFSAQ